MKCGRFVLLLNFILYGAKSEDGVYVVSDKEFNTAFQRVPAADETVFARSQDIGTSVCNILKKRPSLIRFYLGCSSGHLITSMLGSFGVKFHPNVTNTCVTGSYRADYEGTVYSGKRKSALYTFAIYDLMGYWGWKSVTWILDGFCGLKSTDFAEELYSLNITNRIIQVNITTLKPDFYANLLRMRRTDGFVATCSLAGLNLLLPQIKMRPNSDCVNDPPWIIAWSGFPMLHYWNGTLHTQITFIKPKVTALKNSMNFTANLTGFEDWDRVETICQGSENAITTLVNAKGNLSVRRTKATLKMSMMEYFDVLYNYLTGGMEMVKFAQWTQENRLNMLERFADADKKFKLHGRLISGVTINDPPYSTVNKQTMKIGGFVVEMFAEILRAMNAVLDVRPNEDSQFGEFVNGSWSGVVGALNRKKADLGVVKLGMTAHRISDVRFSAPIHRGKMIVVIRRPSDTTANSYFQPFHFHVWIVLCLLLFLTVFTLCMCHGYICQTSSEHRATWSFRQCLGDFLTGTLLVEVIWGEVRGISSRILFMTLGLTAYLAFSHYGCDFMSTRTTQGEMVPFKSMDELAAHSDYILTFVRSLSVFELFKNAQHGTSLFAIWSKLRDNDLKDLVRTQVEGLERVYSGPYALLVDSNVADHLLGRNCSFFVLPSVYSRNFYHAGARKDFPHTKLMSTTLIQMMEHGILDLLSKRHMYFPPSGCEDTAVEDVAFGLLNVLEPLSVLCGGLILSLTVLCLEILLFNCENAEKALACEKKANQKFYVYKTERFRKNSKPYKLNN